MVILRKITSLVSDRGQDMMEFAITLPVLALIVFGIFDLGRVVYYYSAMQNAAREGARYGVVNPWQQSAVINRTEERTLGIDPGQLNVAVNYDCDYVKVTVSYTFDPMMPFLGDIPISTSSQLQRERWDAGIGEPDEGCTPGV